MAVSVFKEAINNLLQKAPINLIQRIVIAVGNDLFNVDGADEMTTAGTPQMEDSRWQNTFKKGCSLLKEVIGQLAIDLPVDVLIIPGNHDSERSFYLGEFLSAFFKDHPNVSIDNTPTLRKYYKFGETLIGYTHGDKEKKDQLPLLMATECKEDWANTSFKEYHLGHLHKEMDDEIMGVKIRTLSSLAPADAWHSSKGYVGSIRGARAFLYHVDNGLEAQYYYNLKK
jgi:DNA repair exonuclease SbcCD nuclease subunit